ncbi:MAG: hypothetical protein Q8N81_01580 [bacterium]|nr:hypothetical protein [bacterium]
MDGILRMINMVKTVAEYLTVFGKSGRVSELDSVFDGIDCVARVGGLWN